VEEHIVRARALCEALGPAAPLFHVMMITWALRFIRGRNALAEQLSGEILALAADRDPSYRTEAHWSAACTAWWAGRFADALVHAETGAATWEPGPSAEHARFTQQNSGPLLTAYAGLALWALGRQPEADAKFAAAVAMAETLNHPYTLAVTLWKPGFAAQLAGDGRAALGWAEKVLEVSEAQSFAFWVALGRSLKGAALGLLGRPAEAIPLLEDGLRRIEATGCEMVHQNNLGCLADNLWAVGRRAEAWAALTRALELTARDRERYAEADLLRRKGEFLLAEGKRAEARAALEGAAAAARAQGAAVFEKRAAEALARHAGT
jgi:tetratricopeptide (TPR) repeat protein